MLAVVVREGKAERQDVPAAFSALQEAVGGYVEPFFTEPSPEGNGAITGYVNEEGLVIGLPIHFGVMHRADYIVPLAGNAIIVGLDEGGETRGLTETEAERVLKSFKAPKSGLCPIIEGRIPEPGEAVRVVPVRTMLVLPHLLA